jgi:hypothetical protein
MDRGDQGHAAGVEDAGDGQQVLEAGSATKCKDMTEQEWTWTEEGQDLLQARTKKASKGAEAETQSEQQSEQEQLAAVAAQSELDAESEGWEEMTDALSLPQDAGGVHALLEAQERGEEDVVAVVEEQEGRGILLDGEKRSVLGDDAEVAEVEVLESAPSILEVPLGMEGNAATQDEDRAEVWDENGDPPHSPVAGMDEKAMCALGRKQLQALAKQHGIKANLKNAEIVAELLPLLSHAQPELAAV